MLYDTFSAFGGVLATPKLMRDPDTGNSKGFGFVSFDCFEASDAAIEAMNGQFLCNRPISVSYAYKKDTKGARRHRRRVFSCYVRYAKMLMAVCSITSSQSAWLCRTACCAAPLPRLQHATAHMCHESQMLVNRHLPQASATARRLSACWPRSSAPR